MIGAAGTSKPVNPPRTGCGTETLDVSSADCARRTHPRMHRRLGIVVVNRISSQKRRPCPQAYSQIAPVTMRTHGQGEDLRTIAFLELDKQLWLRPVMMLVPKRTSRRKGVIAS